MLVGRDEIHPLISREEIASPKNRLDATNYEFHKNKLVI